MAKIPKKEFCKNSGIAQSWDKKIKMATERLATDVIPNTEGPAKGF